MKHFKPTTRMSDIIHTNYLLLPVINRFGVRLGFGDKTVEEVCREKKLNAGFFLAILNAYHDPDYFPEKELQGFSTHLIIDYLKKTHDYYREYVIPKVESDLENLMGDCQGNCRNLRLIRSFYDKYKVELLNHLNEEDTRVFPYMTDLQRVYDKEIPMADKVRNFSIRNFEEEHTDIDNKLFDLKNIIIKYLEPQYVDNMCNAFLYAIFQLEQDLIDHARIEDKILVPKIMLIEKAVKS
ncbi:MAG: hypothetical protein GXO81_01530 [Chlorobi bacterium]|nr:hypothetical protein [Chlorobiota bacterium]